MAEEAVLQTLDELKKENEQEESGVKQEESQEQESQEESGKEAAESEEESSEESSEEESSEEESSEDETPEWMKADETEPKFTDSDAAAIRRKWKAKVTEKDDEIEALKKKVSELEQNPNRQQQQTIKDKPKPDDFETDAEYLEALTDYKVQLAREEEKSRTTAEQQERQKREKSEKIEKAVDDHYLRAHKLSEKSGITAEAYQSADKTVRSAVESVFPNAGDAITDALIASVGEGSEKVFYHLGVNPAKRDRLIQLFQEDRSGIRAASYLGTLSAQLNTPKKRETNAPEPSDPIQGDKAGSSQMRQLRDKYHEAHKKGDVQKAFNIKREAKGKNIDVSGW